MKMAAACLPLSNGSFLDFKSEPTHCNHIRTAKHKIDQFSSAAALEIKPRLNLSKQAPAGKTLTGLTGGRMRRQTGHTEQQGRPRQPRPALL
ncbi:hypothetical protein [Sinorhizobium fredii]|uniref:hypothetical protein n=1 Tax=Rhizobium fredii TaxID=380 RepID=UPI0012FD32B6|nr:hypothetical protein [Sinorhizobium fredii]